MVRVEQPRVLVAGLGNIFLGDDAFGVEVVARLATMTIPAGVRLLDVGIRAIHLAYELLEGQYDTLILIDLVSRGGAPGTLYVLEPDDVDTAGLDHAPDAHAIRPHQVLALARQFGGRIPRMVIVGCEPSSLDPEAGSSPVVRAAIDEAVSLVLRQIAAAEPARIVED